VFIDFSVGNALADVTIETMVFGLYFLLLGKLYLLTWMYMNELY
jgi:hypothetical protein